MKIGSTLENQKIEKRILPKFKRDVKISGKTTIFGQMPDWNPVEMIGVVPRNLAFSLYKNLISDEVWYLSRVEMGYSKPIKKKLMYDFCGHPFIDVKSSFATATPTTLPFSFITGPPLLPG